MDLVNGGYPGFVVDADGVIEFPFLRTAYNYDRDAASFDSGLDCSVVPSMTQQQFAEEVDINTIVRNFGLSGELPKDLAVPQSGDFLDVTDFHTSMNVVRAAEESFMKMPAEVRKRFGNDPGEFLAFVHDDANRDEARKLGILVPAPAAPVKAAPQEVVIAGYTGALAPGARPVQRLPWEPPGGSETSST